MRRKLHTTLPRVLLAFAAGFAVIAAGVFAVLAGFALGRGSDIEAWMVVVGAGLSVSLMFGAIPVWFMGHVRAVDRRIMPVMFGILLGAVTWSTFATTGRGFPQNITGFEPWGLRGVAFAVGTMALFGVAAGAVIWTIAYPRRLNEDTLKNQAALFD